MTAFIRATAATLTLSLISTFVVAETDSITVKAEVNPSIALATKQLAFNTQDSIQNLHSEVAADVRSAVDQNLWMDKLALQQSLAALPSVDDVLAGSEGPIGE